MATEHTRLHEKSFFYSSNASIAVKPKSKECAVVMPEDYNSHSCNEQFAGLTLDELYFYMYDPWWSNLRRGICISFWILFLAIFALACIISVIENKQRCTAIMKSLSSADEISRINFTLAAYNMTSNLSMAPFIASSTAIQ